MSLAENLVLLAVTAVLTGFLVPFIKGIIDQRKLLEQKHFEADLARQNKVIESQGALLDRLTDLLWGQILRTVEVQYRAFHGELQAFEEAWKRYDEASWSFFLNTRAEVSKARQLASDQVCDVLLRLYGDFMALDQELVALAKRPALEKEDWASFHYRCLLPMEGQVEGALRAAADEMHLTAKSPVIS